MSETELGRIPQIARELVDHLPEVMNREVKMLISQAEEGQDTSIEIIELFSEYDVTRDWLREQIDSQGQEKSMDGYVPLAGPPRPIAANQKWFCPRDGCVSWMLVIQEGEDPPLCEIHRIEMVRRCQAKG
jgi:hypothetical protein